MMRDTYLLHSSRARELYGAVQGLPIIDYHCHLSPKEILEDRPFDNIGEMWLAGDHYKWRLMRAYGVEERCITGDAPWQEKIRRYAQAVAMAAGNPLYHWTQMELALYFGIEEPLDGDTADDLYARANRVIRERELSPRRLIASSGVTYIATTDDPADPLTVHEQLQADDSLQTVVTPSFRTDNLLLIRRAGYAAYAARLGTAAGLSVEGLDGLEEAVRRRLDAFVACGCRFTDVGIEDFPQGPGTREAAASAYAQALAGQPVADEAYDAFLGYMYRFLAREYRQRGLVMQWHLGVKRNVNSRLFESLGPDCGGDCMNDPVAGRAILRLLDAIERDGGLPTTILYALNPVMCPQLASIAGSFPHVLCGAAWWFCDHLRGIREQLEVIAETGHIGTFLGMLTDSRSFLSYARHDYFRRILCDVVGGWVEDGEFAPQHAEALVRAVAYDNIAALVAAR